MGDSEADRERDKAITALEGRVTAVEARLDKQEIAFEKHTDKIPEDNQNKAVNRAAAAMIVVGIISIFTTIWSTNAVIKSTQQTPKHPGVERTFQGETRP